MAPSLYGATLTWLPDSSKPQIFVKWGQQCAGGSGSDEQPGKLPSDGPREGASLSGQPLVSAGRGGGLTSR